MDEQALIAFITASLSEQTPEEKIRGDLLKAGWAPAMVDAAFLSARRSMPVPPPTPPPAPAPVSSPITSAPAPVTSAAPVMAPQTPLNSMGSAPSYSVSSTNVSYQTADTSLPTRSKRGIYIAIAVVVVLLLVGGGGAFAYVTYTQSPEYVMGKVMENMSTVTSLEYEGEVKVEVEIPAELSSGFMPPQEIQGDSKSSMLVKFSGKSDIQNFNVPKSIFLLNISMNHPLLDNYAFELETRLLDRATYYKFSGLDDLLFFDLNAINGKWIKIDIESIGRKFGVSEQELESLRQERDTVTSDQIEKIKLAVQRANTIQFLEKLESEKIDGVNTFHYKFAVNKAGVRQLLVEIDEILSNDPMTEEELRELDSSISAIDFPEGEIWIGKKDYLTRKLTMKVKAHKSEQVSTSGEVSFTLLFKNFNQPVNIEIPSQAVPVEEILKTLFGGMFDPFASELSDPAQTSNGADAKIKSLISMVRADAELHYDANKNSYAGVCTNKDVISAINAAKASAEILSATNTTLSRAGANRLATCHENGKLGYAVEVPLRSTPMSVFCVDHTGTAKVTAVELTANDITCN